MKPGHLYLLKLRIILKCSQFESHFIRGLWTRSPHSWWLKNLIASRSLLCPPAVFCKHVFVLLKPAPSAPRGIILSCSLQPCSVGSPEACVWASLSQHSTSIQLVLFVVGWPRCWQEQKWLVFESKDTSFDSDDAHMFMEGDSHIRPTFFRPQSHVATLTTSLIPKDGDSYTGPPGQCLWLGQGTGRHPTPTSWHPKFSQQQQRKPMDVTALQKPRPSMRRLSGVLF